MINGNQGALLVLNESRRDQRRLSIWLGLSRISIMRSGRNDRVGNIGLRKRLMDNRLAALENLLHTCPDGANEEP